MEKEVIFTLTKIIIREKLVFFTTMISIREDLILKIIAIKCAPIKNVKNSNVHTPITRSNKSIILPDTRVSFVKSITTNQRNVSTSNSVLLLTIKPKLKSKLFICKLEIMISISTSIKLFGVPTHNNMIEGHVSMLITSKISEEIQSNLNIK